MRKIKRKYFERQKGVPLFALETQGLTKYYSGGKVKALEEFSLQVEKR